MTLSANFTLKSVFDQQSCRALTFALARLSCFFYNAKKQLLTIMPENISSLKTLDTDNVIYLEAFSVLCLLGKCRVNSVVRRL